MTLINHTRCVETIITITITEEAPDDIFTRVTTPEWKAAFITDVNTESEVLDRWAELAAMGFETLQSVDGWSDVGNAVWFSSNPVYVSE